MDTISAGQVVATAMEWYEKGLINEDTTGGIKLEFGNAEALVEIVEKIAKREGYSDILADGSDRTAEKLRELGLK